VTLRARWVTLRARWVTLRARWVTLRARLPVETKPVSQYILTPVVLGWQLYDYDNVLNQQREKLYSERKRAMMAENLESLMCEYAEDTVDDIVSANIDPSQPVEVSSMREASAQSLLHDRTEATREPRNCGRCASTKGHFLSPRAKP
jgi:hypothetical protein